MCKIPPRLIVHSTSAPITVAAGRCSLRADSEISSRRLRFGIGVIVLSAHFTSVTGTRLLRVAVYHRCLPEKPFSGAPGWPT